MVVNSIKSSLAYTHKYEENRNLFWLARVNQLLEPWNKVWNSTLLAK